ncbi:class C sortase [[Clostridium] innocuum]|nr:class C sortase [[Clostridium] innocuum]
MKIRKLLIILLLFSGCGLLLYPGVQMLLSSKHQSVVVHKVESELLQVDKTVEQKELKKAKSYNQSIMGSEVKDPFLPGSGIVLPDNYMDVLNVENGIMGILEIPSIDVKLPIYHGTSEEVLREGVGHLRETALPIGQKGCHSVLSTHRGLPEAKLFTDLDKLTIKDQFYIRLYNSTLAYEVDQIKVVKPSDTRYLKPEKGKDYVTLLTCTPYGINSHRLMVRGKRCKYVEKTKEVISSKVIPLEYIIAAGAAGILLIAVLAGKYRARKGMGI